MPETLPLTLKAVPLGKVASPQAMTEGVIRSAAAPGHDPSRDNGIAERPQALRYPENKNLIPLMMRRATRSAFQIVPAYHAKPHLEK